MAKSGARRVRAKNDILTALLLVAAVALSLAVAYVWYRDSQMTGTANPFKLTAQPNASTDNSSATAS